MNNPTLKKKAEPNHADMRACPYFLGAPAVDSLTSHSQGTGSQGLTEEADGGPHWQCHSLVAHENADILSRRWPRGPHHPSPFPAGGYPTNCISGPTILAHARQ
jgi:hypothetical protein